MAVPLQSMSERIPTKTEISLSCSLETPVKFWILWMKQKQQQILRIGLSAILLAFRVHLQLWLWPLNEK
jgi:hypothetical protein